MCEREYTAFCNTCRQLVTKTPDLKKSSRYCCNGMQSALVRVKYSTSWRVDENSGGLKLLPWGTSDRLTKLYDSLMPIITVTDWFIKYNFSAKSMLARSILLLLLERIEIFCY